MTTEASNATTDLGTCTTGVSFFFGPPEPCHNDATVILRSACVHEHVGLSPTCDEHIRLYTERATFCNECSRSDDPHECPTPHVVAA